MRLDKGRWSENKYTKVTSICTNEVLVKSLFESLGLIWIIKVSNKGATLSNFFYLCKTGTKKKISIPSWNLHWVDLLTCIMHQVISYKITGGRVFSFFAAHQISHF